MITAKEAVARLRAFLNTRSLDRDLEQEWESHVAMLTDDNIRAGLPPDEARRAAATRVGNLGSLRDQHRDLRGLPAIDALLQDVRYASHRLVRDRWFTLAAVVALALGIGANSAVFTLVNAVLLRGLPFDQPDRIMWIDTRDARGRQLGVSLVDFEDWRRASRTLSGMTLVQSGGLAISGDDRLPENYNGGHISANAFDLIGAKAILGRGFVPADDAPGAPPVVLISGGIWKSRHASDPTVIGRSIRINSLPATLIGVMPDGLTWPFGHEVWTPMSQLPPALRNRGRQTRGYVAYGRLADGVTVEQAQSEMANIAAQLAQQYPETNKDITIAVTRFLDRAIGSQIRTMFWSLLGAVAFVLLIACANVANLLLARAAQRSREIAVRVSLGATRGRIVRQLLVESLLLALVSGVAGLGFAYAVVRWFDSETQNIGKPYWMTFDVDVNVFVFFAAVCVLTGIIFGLAPALQISRTNLNDLLSEGGRAGSGGIRARRWTAALVVTELALTLVLLAGAGVMMRSFVKLYRLDVGFDTSRLLTMTYILPTRKYATREARMDFIQRMEERLNALGAVVGASTTTVQPLLGGAARQLAIDGKASPSEDESQTITLLSVGPRYFEALGVRFVRGRSFDAHDGSSGREVAIINQRLASMNFGSEDPVGQRIRVSDDTPGAPTYEWATIVGLVPNIRQRASQSDPEPDPVVYLPHLQNSGFIGSSASIIVRGRSDPGELTPLLRKEVSALDPDLPLNNVRTMDENLADQRWFARVFGTMFSVFAGIAIVLAAVGLFAVTAYSVAQRTQEIGVRMALGAHATQISWLILRRCLVHLGIGLTIGMAGTFAVERLLRSLLFQTSMSDPVTLVVITVLLACVAIAACLWPAWQASRLDPVTALRYE
jgi:putative ABC transport system permease protein